MCLLDEVAQWDDQSIVCITNTHRDPVNPLRREGRLSALHAFEYGAQAAASAWRVCEPARPGTTAAPGYLAALRDGRLNVTRLDQIHLSLRVCATRLFGDRANTVYEFPYLGRQRSCSRGTHYQSCSCVSDDRIRDMTRDDVQ